MLREQLLRFKTQGYEPYLRIEALRLDRMEEREMESLKEEAISAISKMPDSADIDEIMYSSMSSIRSGRGEKLFCREMSSQLKS